MANLKRNALELVKSYDAENDKVETKVYYTPAFIPLGVVYEAIDLTERMEKNEEKKSEKELINELVAFVANDIYKGQFTVEELENGLHAPDAMRVLQEQIVFVARGGQSQEAKKLVAKRT